MPWRSLVLIVSGLLGLVAPTAARSAPCPATELAVHVQDLGGTPVSGAVVKAQTSEVAWITDAEGNAQFRGDIADFLVITVDRQGTLDRVPCDRTEHTVTVVERFTGLDHSESDQTLPAPLAMDRRLPKWCLGCVIYRFEWLEYGLLTPWNAKVFRVHVEWTPSNGAWVVSTGHADGMRLRQISNAEWKRLHRNIFETYFWELAPYLPSFGCKSDSKAMWSGAAVSGTENVFVERRDPHTDSPMARFGEVMLTAAGLPMPRTDSPGRTPLECSAP